MRLKHFIFFTILTVLAFGLFLPKICQGQTDTCLDEIGTVYYSSECEEQIEIGSCSRPECCEYDNGNCIERCPCPQCSCEGEWDEYRCQNEECDGDILVRHCAVSCCPNCYCEDGDRCSTCSGCKVECTEEEICLDCGSWQKPEREPPCEDCEKWGFIKPGCKCEGDCIDKPGNPRYYDNPTYPTDPCDPEEGVDPQNIYLPVKLDWDDVEGWEDGWIENSGCKCVKNCQIGDKRCVEDRPEECLDLMECKKECKEGCFEEISDCSCLNLDGGLKVYQDYYENCLAECEDGCEEEYKTDREGCENECSYPDQCYPPQEYVQSYVIKIEGEMRDENGEDISEYEEVLDKSEFTPPHSCFYKTNRTYQWQVRGCCPTKGVVGAMCCAERDMVCGPWSGWEFYANPAPEPKLPYDPDWNEPEKRENLPKEQIDKLEWCEINDPERYGRRIIQGEEWYSPRSYKVLIYYLDPVTGEYICHPNLETEEGCQPKILKPEIETRLPFPSLIHYFEFEDENHTYFTKLNSYSWKVAACEGFAGYNPTDYSQEWRFSVEDFTLPPPENPSPPDNKEIPVGLPLLLRWESPWAHSFNYIIKGGGKTITGETDVHNVQFDYPDLSLNTVYNWKINPCWDYKSEECEGLWSDTWYFKTTGQPPNLIYPENNASEVAIPVNFKWEDVGGAESYIFKINGEEKIVDESEITLDYPDLQQETKYLWQVKTCARYNGEICGGWSTLCNFTTLKLKPPTNPTPKDGSTVSTIGSHLFSWDEILGAKYYQFQIEYSEVSAEEKRKECIEKEGETTTKIISKNSIYHPLICNGEYQWQIRGCLTENCEAKSVGDWSELWTFTLYSPEAPPGEIKAKEKGLVPCGRTYNYPDTPWDETEPCGIKHIFIMLKIIIDFLLFKLAPICLALLTAASGVIFYFSLRSGSATPLARVKSLWKSAGIGFGILLFAWLIISLAFTLIGYQFGPWWRI